MYTFRAKPLLIEAFQMTKKHRNNNADWPNWLHKAWQKEKEEEGSLWPIDNPHGGLAINTAGRDLVVPWNDFIILGVQGNIYTCSHSAFESTYEKVC